MNDWARDAVAKLRKRTEEQRIKDQKFIETRKIKRAQGRPLWNEVKRITKENAEALNKEAGRELISFHPQFGDDRMHAVAQLDNGVRHLEAAFDDELGNLNWTCDGKSGGCSVVVEDNGEARLQWSMIPTTPASIAKQMLDALLFG